MEIPEIPFFNFDSNNIRQDWANYVSSFENLMPFSFELTHNNEQKFIITKPAMLFLINICNQDAIPTSEYTNVYNVLTNEIPHLVTNKATHLGLLARVLYEKTNMSTSIFRQLIWNMPFDAKQELLDSSFIKNELNFKNIKGTDILIDIIAEAEYTEMNSNVFKSGSPLANDFSSISIEDALLDNKHPLSPFLTILFRYDNLIDKSKRFDFAFDRLIGHNLNNLNKVDSSYFKSDQHETCFNLSIYLILKRIHGTCADAFNDEVICKNKVFTTYVKDTSEITILNQQLEFYKKKIQNSTPDIFKLIETHELFGLEIDIANILEIYSVNTISEITMPDLH